MQNWELPAVILGLLILLVICRILAKEHKPVRNTFWGIFQGAAALAAVNIAAPLTAVALPVSVLSVGISCAFGIPGVILMLVLNIILQLN